MTRILVFPACTDGHRVDIPQGYVDQMFEMIHDNMSRIVPVAHTKEEDRRMWLSALARTTDEGTRHILVVRADVVLGYLSFTVRNHCADVFINEIEVLRSHQGNGTTFGGLLSTFLKEARGSGFDTIRAYVNRLNTRSRTLVIKLGFKEELQLDRGTRFVGALAHLEERLLKVSHRFGGKTVL